MVTVTGWGSTPTQGIWHWRTDSLGPGCSCGFRPHSYVQVCSSQDRLLAQRDTCVGPCQRMKKMRWWDYDHIFCCGHDRDEKTPWKSLWSLFSLPGSPVLHPLLRLCIEACRWWIVLPSRWRICCLAWACKERCGRMFQRKQSDIIYCYMYYIMLYIHYIWYIKYSRLQVDFCSEKPILFVDNGTTTVVEVCELSFVSPWKHVTLSLSNFLNLLAYIVYSYIVFASK